MTGCHMHTIAYDRLSYAIVCIWQPVICKLLHMTGFYMQTIASDRLSYAIVCIWQADMQTIAYDSLSYAIVICKLLHIADCHMQTIAIAAWRCSIYQCFSDIWQQFFIFLNLKMSTITACFGVFDWKFERWMVNLILFFSIYCLKNK